MSLCMDPTNTIHHHSCSPAHRAYLVIHVFDDQQHWTVHVYQAPVQSLQAGPMFHSTIGQSPGVTLHTGWQATGELEGKTSRNEILVTGAFKIWIILSTMSNFMR